MYSFYDTKAPYNPPLPHSFLATSYFKNNSKILKKFIEIMFH